MIILYITVQNVCKTMNAKECLLGDIFTSFINQTIGNKCNVHQIIELCFSVGNPPPPTPRLCNAHVSIEQKDDQSNPHKNKLLVPKADSLNDSDF